jgi:hypothetical protein
VEVEVAAVHFLIVGKTAYIPPSQLILLLIILIILVKISVLFVSSFVNNKMVCGRGHPEGDVV